MESLILSRSESGTFPDYSLVPIAESQAGQQNSKILLTDSDCTFVSGASRIATSSRSDHPPLIIDPSVLDFFQFLEHNYVGSFVPDTLYNWFR